MDRNLTFDVLWSEFRKTEQRGIHAFRKELEVIGRQFNTLTMIFDEIQSRFSDDDDLKEIWYFHIAKTLTSFEGAISNALRGLFSESANLIRTGLETAWQLLYLHDKPDKRGRWLNDKRIATAEVREHLSSPEEFNLRREIYETFCEVSHPRRKGMEWYFTYMRGYMRFGPTFEPEYVRNHLHRTSQFLGWIHEDVIRRLYPDAFGSPLNEPVPPLIAAYLQNREQYREVFANVTD